MHTKIQKWGNSLALRIPKVFADLVKIRKGSDVDISVDDGKLLISVISEEEYSLEDFLSKIDENNIHEEITFGDSVGREVW